MAPINLPDGSQVSEIVLPDGSTASEVLAPDGSTVFGNAIPDSAIHRWKFDTLGDGTAEDSVGTADGTVNGVSPVVGNWVGGEAGDGDGTNDFITSSAATKTFGSEISTGASVAFTVQRASAPSSNEFLMGSFDSSGSSAYPFFFTTQSALEWTVTDDNGNFQSVNADWTPLFDGNPHRVVIRQSGLGGSNVDIFYDGSSQSTTVRNDDIATSVSDLAYEWYNFARNNNGSAGGFSDVILDDVILFDAELSNSEITDDYNRQPWS